MARYDFIDLEGVVVADTADTKSEVESEYKQIFGEDIDLSDESAVGVLVNAETASRSGIAKNNSLLANQINPKEAGGVFLDAIWALTSGLTGGRKSATQSSFTQAVDVTGVPFTLIPAGSIALTVSGDRFYTLADVTLDGAGDGSVGFKSVETGQVVAGIGELDTVASGSPLGWETVSNPVAATLGRDEESDEISRNRRIDTLALQGISMAEAITAAISNLDNVKSLSYRENFTKADLTIDGVFLLASSIYVNIDGGDSVEIATALLENKTAGANWNGTETESITEPTTGQVYPVKFARPDEVQVWVRVTIAPTAVSSPADVISTAVLKYADGLLSEERGFVVGSAVSPFEISGAVNRNTPEIFVRLVELSDDGITYAVAEIPIEVFEVARTSKSQITTVIS